MENNPHFLLIEDNLIDQLVIKQLLKKVLHTDQIIIANNGKEGLQGLHDNKNKYPSLIILLDIQMPIMNGFEFLNEFHKLPYLEKKEIQIYVLSSTLHTEEIKIMQENNYVTAFLSKPFPIEEFARRFYPKKNDLL
jgi:CheY-like chemotaxis protein